MIHEKYSFKLFSSELEGFAFSRLIRLVVRESYLAVILGFERKKIINFGLNINLLAP
jgi:hypothetical protein